MQALPQADAEGELIGLGGDRAAGMLLGGHVVRRPHPLAGEGEVGLEDALPRRWLERHVVVVTARPRQAEVEHHDALLADDHVRRLEVAMHDPGGMGSGQPSPGGEEGNQHLAPAPFAGAQPFRQRRSLDQLHGDEHLVAIGADVVDGDDVGVVQAGQRLRFPEQAGAGDRRLDHPVGVDELQGDGAAELGVERGKHMTHPAGADERADGIPAEAVAGANLRLRALDRCDPRRLRRVANISLYGGDRLGPVRVLLWQCRDCLTNAI